MREKAVQALSAIAAVLVLIALFTPLWSISGPFGYSSEIRLSYIDILTNIGHFSSPFSGGHNSVADSQAAMGITLIIISAFCALVTLILSVVSAASKKGTSVAAAFAWVTVVTAYIGTERVISASLIMRAVTSTIVNINMGTAVVFMILAGVLLIAAWVLKR